MKTSERNSTKTLQFFKTWTVSAIMTVAAAFATEDQSFARVIDGFFMYCTSNLDGTGVCTNQEDGREFACLIVPGQIISCPSANSQSVECVWISGITANSAQFWCDPSKEAAMYGEELNRPSQNMIENVTPRHFNQNIRPINSNDLNKNIFQDSLDKQGAP